jgi:hypothetical protein
MKKYLVLISVIGLLVGAPFIGASSIEYHWSINGDEVCKSAGDQIKHKAIPDGFGGFYIAWLDFRNSTNQYGHIYAQHIDSNGNAVWADNGIEITSADSISNDNPLDLVRSLDGGMFISWCDNRNGTGNKVYVQHVSSSGH